MKKVAISLSALFLALGVLSGCGEKKEEAPKEEAPKAEQTGMSGMSGMSAEQEGMSGMSGMSAEQEGMSGMSGMSAEQEGMSGMSGMSAEQGGMSGMSGMSAEQAGMSGMSGMSAEQAGMSGMSGMSAEQAGAVDGEKVYRGLCFSCHDTGVANAPKLGDKAAWEPRIATGMDVLYDTALHGNPKMPAMPAKGGNPALSDDEVKAAVDWMVAQAK